MACGRIVPDTGEPVAVRFQVEAQPAVKGGEFTGTSASERARILVAVTEKDADGNVLYPSVFRDGDNPAAAQLVKDGTHWTLDDYYFPLGGHLLDVLAFGVDSDETTKDLSSFGSSVWVPTFDASQAANGVRFENVSTYAAQMDMMYASANHLSAENPEGHLNMQHAMAQLIFNVFFPADDPDAEFIETNGSDYIFKINDILFLNDAGLEQYKASQTVSAANILLKTKGTFIIDNSKNEIDGWWDRESLASVLNCYRLPMDLTRRSNANDLAEATPWFDNTRTSWERNITRGKRYQVGNTLLVPEQPIQRFSVYYTFNNTAYMAKIQLPGDWISGQKYIYTLNISIRQDNVYFTVSVNDMEAGKPDVTASISVEPMGSATDPSVMVGSVTVTDLEDDDVNSETI